MKWYSRFDERKIYSLTNSSSPPMVGVVLLMSKFRLLLESRGKKIKKQRKAVDTGFIIWRFIRFYNWNFFFKQEKYFFEIFEMVKNDSMWQVNEFDIRCSSKKERKVIWRFDCAVRWEKRILEGWGVKIQEVIGQAEQPRGSAQRHLE